MAAAVAVADPEEAAAARELKHAVGRFVREVLGPHFKSGEISREQFKRVAKKATGKVADSHRGVSAADLGGFLTEARRRKIAALVEKYVENEKRLD